MYNVLLVEDCRVQAIKAIELLSKDFIGQDALEVTWVSTLEEGIAKTVGGGYDIVVLDLMLPDSHGVETFKRFKACCPNMPVLIHTGVEEREVALDCIKNGAQDFCYKTESHLLRKLTWYAIERSKYIKRYKRQSQRLRAIIDSLPLLVMRFNLAYEISFVSDHTGEFYQISPHDVMGHYVGDIYSPPFMAEVIMACKKINLINRSVGPIIEENGGQFIEWRFSGVFDRHVLKEIQGIGQDVTERVREVKVLEDVADQYGQEFKRQASEIRAFMDGLKMRMATA